MIYVVLGLYSPLFHFGLAFFMIKMKNDIYIEQEGFQEMKIKFFFSFLMNYLLPDLIKRSDSGIERALDTFTKRCAICGTNGEEH